MLPKICFYFLFMIILLWVRQNHVIMLSKILGACHRLLKQSMALDFTFGVQNCVHDK